jgi:hypothetical protein
MKINVKQKVKNYSLSFPLFFILFIKIKYFNSIFKQTQFYKIQLGFGTS